MCGMTMATFLSAGLLTARDEIKRIVRPEEVKDIESDWNGLFMYQVNCHSLEP